MFDFPVIRSFRAVLAVVAQFETGFRQERRRGAKISPGRQQPLLHVLNQSYGKSAVGFPQDDP